MIFKKGFNNVVPLALVLALGVVFWVGSASPAQAYHFGGPINYNGVYLGASGSSPKNTAPGVISVTVDLNNSYTPWYWAVMFSGHVQNSAGGFYESQVWSYGWGTWRSHTFTFSGLPAGDYIVGGDAMMFWWNGWNWVYWNTLGRGGGSLNIRPYPDQLADIKINGLDQATVNYNDNATVSWVCGESSFVDSVMAYQVESQISGAPVYNYGCSGYSCPEPTSSSVSHGPVRVNSEFHLGCDYSATKPEWPRYDDMVLVTVNPPTLSLPTVSPSIPSTVINSPVSVTAVAEGSAVGNITFKLDCASDGVYETSAVENKPYGSQPVSHTFTNACSYSQAGSGSQAKSYLIKVRAEHNFPVFAESSAYVYVYNPVSVDLKADGSNGPVTITSGGSATLSWTSSNAASCVASAGSWSGSKAVSGSQSTGALTTGAYSYTLACMNPASSAADSVTVNVSPPALSASCSANKTTAVTGESVRWTAAASGGTGTYSYSWSGSSPLAGGIGNIVDVSYTSSGNKTGSVTVTSGSQTVPVNCSNSVTVFPILNVSCSANKTAVVTGESVNWNASVSGGAGFYSYTWGGSSPLSGKTTGGSASVSYTSVGLKEGNVTVTSGSQTVTANCSNSVGVYQGLAVSCSADKSTAVTKETVTWAATASGGIGSYSYTWDGTTPLAGKAGASAAVSYPSSGAKTGSVTVTSSGGQSASASCSNSPTIYEPSLTVTAPNTTVQTGLTLQMTALLDPDGSGPQAGGVDKTGLSSWLSADTQKATISNTSPTKGLVTGVGAIDNVNITANYTDSYGNIASNFLGIKVIPTPEFTCTPAFSNPSPAFTNQNVSFTAGGGYGSYQWTTVGGSPSSGSGTDFTTKYADSGTKSIEVKSLSLTKYCSVNILSPTLSVALSAEPASGEVQVNSTLRADVTSNLTNSTNYSFWWNCNDATTSVAAASAACGALPAGVWGQCRENQNGAKCDGMSRDNYAVSHTYSGTANYTPKVIAERGAAPNDEDRSGVTVSQAFAAGCSANKTAAVTKETVKWTATASGGTGTYSYSWGGSSPLSGKTGASAEVAYSSAGAKNGSVTVTSGSRTTTSSCSNSVTVYAPTLTVTAPNNYVRVDETLQMTSSFDPDGAGPQAGGVDKTSLSSWSSARTDKAAVSNTSPTKGLVTGQSSISSVAITASYTDSYNNNVSGSLPIEVKPAPTLSCANSPSNPSPALTNQNVSFVGQGGVGTHQWTTIGGSPSSASLPPEGAERQTTFITKYGSSGNKTISVQSSSQTVTCAINIKDPTLSVGLSASPASGEVQFSSALKAEVTSNVSDTTNYSYWWNCSDATKSVAEASAACGALPAGARGQCRENQNGAKCDGISADSYTVNHTYSGIGSSYTPKVIVERGSAPSAQSRAGVSVLPPANNPPSPGSGGSAPTPQGPQAPPNWSTVYCGSALIWTLNWSYSDPNGDPQASYQIIIRDKSTDQVIMDTGKVSSSSNTYSVPAGLIQYNKTYGWTIQVWDANPYNPMSSGVIPGADFQTIPHAPPAVSFSWLPTTPSKDEQVTFTDTTTVSGGATIASRLWNSGGGVDLSPLTGPQLVTQYTTAGTKVASLIVADSDGYSCQGFDDLNINKGVPSVKEIAP